MTEGYGKLIFSMIGAVILDALFLWALNDIVSTGINTIVILGVISFVVFLGVLAIISEKIL